MKKRITILTALMIGFATLTQAITIPQQDTTPRKKVGAADKQHNANKPLQKEGKPGKKAALKVEAEKKKPVKP